MASIDDFFVGKRYALVDVDPLTPYGRGLAEKLRSGGREVHFVLGGRIAGGTASGEAIHADLAEVPSPIDGVILNIEKNPDRMLAVTKTAVEKGVPRIWIENRCDPGEAVDYAVAHGVTVVDNVCALLALDAGGIHWFHRKVLDVFGRTPKSVEGAG